MRFAVALTAGLLALTGTAEAAGPTLDPDGTTAAVYDYTQAVRERAFIPQPGIDQDRNGVDDKVTVDIIRPNGAGPFPAIVDASPYYTSVCRGLRSECTGDKDADGVNDLWPLFVDNYFVPRGYAVVLAQMNGTGYTSDGCPYHGGPGDIAGMKSVIQWIGGRPWSNGASAMIGKSYDGTLANDAADGDETGDRNPFWEDRSGIASITYSIGGGPPIPVNADHASVPVAAEGITTIHYSATDRAGNTEADQALTVQVDTTAPVVVCPADTRWRADNVTIACTASDTGSGLAGGAAFTLRTTVPAGTEDAHATASRGVCDVAGNCPLARPVRRIDRRAPTITLTPPAVNVFARGEVVAIGHRCADAGSGVATCSGPSALDTATAGPHTLTFTARDVAGNTRTQAWSYQVLGALPRLGIQRRGRLKLALTGPLHASATITGTVKLHGRRGKVRTLRVTLDPGQARVVTLKVPKRFKTARGLDLKLVTTAGALSRTDRFKR